MQKPATVWLAMYSGRDVTSNPKAGCTTTAHEVHRFPDPTSDRVFVILVRFSLSLRTDATAHTPVRLPTLGCEREGRLGSMKKTQLLLAQCGRVLGGSRWPLSICSWLVVTGPLEDACIAATTRDSKYGTAAFVQKAKQD